MTESEPNINDVYRLLQEQKVQNEEILRHQREAKERAEKERDNPEAYSPDPDAVSVNEWVESYHKPGKKSLYRGRCQLLSAFAVANGRTVERVKTKGGETYKLDSAVKEVESILAEIKAGKLRVYKACKTFTDWLVKENYAPYTRSQFRSLLPELFIRTLGSRNFDRDKFDDLVPSDKVYVVIKKLVPKLDHVLVMVKSADLQYRAIIEMFYCLGWRIEEILSRKWSDLTVHPEGYAVVFIKAKDTKAKYDRWGYLTAEAVGCLRAFRASLIDKRRESDWIFPGYLVDKEGYPKQHLGQTIVERELKRLFKEAGCYDTKDGSGIYSSHSFRTMCDSALSRCNFDRKYIDMTIGHKTPLAAGFSYQDWEEAKRQWVERCMSGMVIEKVVEVIENEKLLRAQANKIEQLESQDKIKTAAILALADKAGVSVEELVRQGAVKMGKLAQLSQKQLEELDEKDGATPTDGDTTHSDTSTVEQSEGEQA